MDSKIIAGCSSGFGQGGLGTHLKFIHRASDLAGHAAGIYCREAPGQPGFVNIPGPSWGRWMKYTPIRWLPSSQVYWAGLQFDRQVAGMFPDRPVVYHSFPGFAEETFRKVKASRGITVLEAATTHVEDLYHITETEHRKYGISGSPFSRVWVNRVLREYNLADYISVASRLQYDGFIRRGYPKERLLYSPLGVDTGRFSPGTPLNENTGEHASPDGTFRIIQVGQISLRKGFLYLLDAVEKIGDPEIEVVLYGGIGWRGIRKVIEEYQARGVRVVCRSGDPVPAMRDSHLCIHSSVEDGFGLAPLEAMAVGLPTVVTDMTGMKDVIDNGVNGFVVPSKDSGALADCIIQLKRDESFRLRMSQAARASSLEYDVVQSARHYADTLMPIWNAV